MTNWAGRRLQKLFGRPSAPVASSRHASFRLYLDKLEVGTLSVEGGRWRWEYSEAFRAQQDLRPIVQFPDVNKVYESGELWSFFASRIPSLKQETFRQQVDHDKVDPNDEIALLGRYGQRTVTNPFLLKAA